MRVLAGLLLLLATTADAVERVCFFRGGQAHLCNGNPSADSYTLGSVMPGVVFPARIVEGFVLIHYGTSFREGNAVPPPSVFLSSTPLGGFFTVSVSKPEGTTLLVAGLHRDLGARWQLVPATVVQATDVIMASWSCQAFQWNGAGWDALTIQNDHGLCIEK